jgi:hypothetical protein
MTGLHGEIISAAEHLPSWVFVVVVVVGAVVVLGMVKNTYELRVRWSSGSLELKPGSKASKPSSDADC